MNFEYTDKVEKLRAKLSGFMNEVVYPNEQKYFEEHEAQDDRWQSPAIMEEMKAKARDAGLWNLFLPESELGAGLTNLEYAPLCEIMGRSPIAPEVFNCSAPDTGNMEVLERYGDEAQKERWLEPLLAGEIRSAFAMTEPKPWPLRTPPTSSPRIVRDGDDYVINGHKWWISGAGDTALRNLHLHGQDRFRRAAPPAAVDDPGAARHAGRRPWSARSPCSATTTPRTAISRSPSRMCGCRPPTCCSARAAASRSPRAALAPDASTTACVSSAWPSGAWRRWPARAKDRVAFGKTLAEQGVGQGHDRAWQPHRDRSGPALTLKAADMMDKVGNKAARGEIAAIKVVAPNMALDVIDRAIQIHGAGGVAEDFGLAHAWGHARTLRLADGPDDVHLASIAKLELGKQTPQWLYQGSGPIT